MGAEQDTFAKKFEREYDAIVDLIKRRLWVGLIFICILVLSLGYNAFNIFHGIPKLEKEINRIKGDLLLCETKLTPFKTVAANWYQGTEAERLSKLALKISDIDDILNAQKHFQEIAKITISGSIPLGGGLSTSSGASGWGKNDCAKIKKNSIEFNCREECFAQFNDFAKKGWPYSKFGLAECLKEKGDETWKVHAKAGLYILNQMNLVPHHDAAHTTMLKYFHERYPEIEIKNINIPD